MFNASPQVAYRYQPLFSCEFHDFLSESMRPEDVEAFHGQILQAKSEFVVPKHDFRMEVPPHLAWKSARYHHLSSALLQNSAMQVIFLSRDPESVLNSWYNAPREFLPAWDIHAEWRAAPSKNRGRPEEFFGFEGWLQAPKIHCRNAELFPDRVQLRITIGSVNAPLKHSGGSTHGPSCLGVHKWMTSLRLLQIASQRTHTAPARSRVRSLSPMTSWRRSGD